MLAMWVFLAYGASVVLALVLLYLFHSRWYWHVLSVLAAFAVGLSPPVNGWDGPGRDLIYGSVFLFLLVWGLGEPFLHHFHRHGLHHA